MFVKYLLKSEDKMTKIIQLWLLTASENIFCCRSVARRRRDKSWIVIIFSFKKHTTKLRKLAWIFRMWSEQIINPITARLSLNWISFHQRRSYDMNDNKHVRDVNKGKITVITEKNTFLEVFCAQNVQNRRRRWRKLKVEGWKLL